MRTWLRTRTTLTALVGDRVFFGIPAGITYPMIAISRVGGGPMRAGPLDAPRLSFAVWGNTKKDAADVVKALVAVLHEMEMDRLDPSSVGEGAEGITVLWLPDPNDDRPRYIVDATVTVLALAAA